jgi:hypothetical protein
MNQDMYGVVKPMVKGGHAVFAGPIAGPFAAIPTFPAPVPVPILLPPPPFLPIPVPVPLSSKQASPMMQGGQAMLIQRGPSGFDIAPFTMTSMTRKFSKEPGEMAIKGIAFNMDAVNPAVQRGEIKFERPTFTMEVAPPGQPLMKGSYGPTPIW